VLRKKYENEEALITARVEEEETKEMAEPAEESSGDELRHIDLEQVTRDNDQVSVNKVQLYITHNV